MLATFCLRLACGLIGSLMLFSPRQVNARFYRVQFLVTLGLVVSAAVMLLEGLQGGSGILLALAAIACLLASILWSLEGSPGGRVAIGVTFILLAAALLVTTGAQASLFLLGTALTSAALLGTATTAMLMGHSYLIAPTMSLKPLLTLLRALLVAVLLRMTVAAVGLWSWTASHWPVTLEDEIVLWLPVRWAIGFVGPFILGYMAWQAAKIRSTQSATGILYVAVVCCYLGELLGLLLSNTSHNIL
jgi:hypothetical protein